jgi:hypothetical protein
MYNRPASQVQLALTKDVSSTDMELLDATIRQTLTERLTALEQRFDGDVVFFYGPLDHDQIRPFRDFIERTVEASSPRRNRLVFFLNTPGGSAEAVEKMAEIVRYHYSEVYFVVPDAALSAGTILCMAGDRIYMDYSSSLGPIDPQVWNGKSWVPALGYLDKVEQLLDKAQSGNLSNAEFLILQNQDLAMLSRFEQARDLTVTLLKNWLVEYKFRDWTVHQTNPEKIGQAVTHDEKKQRAEEIARSLGNNKTWHSHGRLIGPATLNSVLRLKIDDYSSDNELRKIIREYNELLTQYIRRLGLEQCMHSRELLYG